MAVGTSLMVVGGAAAAKTAAATAALKTAVAATAVGAAGAAAAKAAAGASAKAAAGASAKAAAAKAAKPKRHFKGVSGKSPGEFRNANTYHSWYVRNEYEDDYWEIDVPAGPFGSKSKREAFASKSAKASSGKAYKFSYEEFYAKAAKAKKYSDSVEDAVEAAGNGVKGGFKKIKGFIAKASKIVTWPFLLFSGSSYEGKNFGVRFNGVNEVKGKNGTYYVPAVGLNGGQKQNGTNGYRSSKYKASNYNESNYSSRKPYEGKYKRSSRSGKSLYKSRSSSKRRH